MNWSSFVRWIEQPHVYVTAAVAAILVWEHWLSRTKKIASNSTLELLGNALVAFGKLWIPGVQAELAPAEAAIAKVEQPAPPRQAGYAHPSFMWFALAAGSVALAFALAGCGPSALQMAQTSIAAAEQVQADALPGARAYFKMHEQSIVDRGEADAAKQIAAFRVQADQVSAALHALADASHVAKGAAVAAQSGSLDVLSLAPLLGQLYAAALSLAKFAKAIGWTVPGLDKLLPPSAFSQQPPSSRRMPRRLTWTVA